VLTARLNDPDERCAQGSQSPQHSGIRRPPPVRQLLTALREKNPAIRVEAVLALGGVGHQRPGLVVPAVVGALRDENKEVRVRAIWALAGVRPADRFAISGLIEALKEKDVSDNVGLSVCRSAAWALARMGPAAAREAIPAVVEWLDSSDRRLQSDALRVLDAVGRC
jgi:HEAT repeat protein